MLLLPLTLAGCLKQLVMLGYLIGGPPSIEPDFDMMTKKSMTAKDVTVAVVCYAPLEVKYDFSAIDAELAKYVTYRLVQHKVKVVNPDQVRAWLDENADNWDEPSEIGRALHVKYVVYIDGKLQSLGRAQPRSAPRPCRGLGQRVRDRRR